MQSEPMKEAMPSAALTLHGPRPEEATRSLMANRQGGTQQQGSHRCLPVQSSNFWGSGPEAVAITRNRKERTIFQPSPQSFSPFG